MVGGDAIRRGLQFFVVGKLVSGVLGVVWLALLARTLAGAQLGVYYGVMSVFEITQMLSSVGGYSYAQRYVPAAWVTTGRAEFTRLLLALVAWRFGTLLVGCTLLGVAWSAAIGLLSWAEGAPLVGVVLCFVLLEGLARYLDALLECTISQGVSQTLTVVRNFARIGIVLVAAGQGVALDANLVIGMEAGLAAVYFVAAAAWLLKLAANRSITPTSPVTPGDQRSRLRFALEGYLSLALAQAVGVDVVRLMLSALAGPAVLAVFAFAQALVDIVRRYMPASLLLGFVRSVLTARAADQTNADFSLARVQMLTRVNGIFLALVCAWLVLFGDATIRVVAGRVGFGEASGYVVALAALLYVQTIRLMAVLVAHMQQNNKVVLAATCVSVVSPVIAALSIPLIGGAGALLALWVQELAYTAVVLRGLRLKLPALTGPLRFWWCTALAAAAGVACAGLAHWALEGKPALWVAAAVYVAVFVFVGWVSRPFEKHELATLRNLVLRRA